jgi:uncharacterized ferritin-like protein (DUF455 family)
MDSKTFVKELEDSNRASLASLVERDSPAVDPSQLNIRQLLEVALLNEINVSELAALWMPNTPEMDVKLALAKQAGDEADHFSLIERRLKKLGISTADFSPPPPNPLFNYLRNLESTVEKIAAGQFTLESIAYQVNEQFMKYCGMTGEFEIVKIYQERIQPDELHHHQLGRALLEKYAVTPETQEQARRAASKTLEMAIKSRQMNAQKFGTSCFPGC